MIDNLLELINACRFVAKFIHQYYLKLWDCILTVFSKRKFFNKI
jgi:hypothetical protein